MEVQLSKTDKKDRNEAGRNFRGMPWMLLALALLAFIPYLPALRADFLDWDDPYYVTHNFRIHQFSPATVADIFRLEPQLGPIPNGQYTPLTELTLMIEHRLVGLSPWLFHLNNLLIHVANVFLVYLLMRKLRADHLWAWLTAVLFAVHPLHVESVAWISERKDVLCALFYLITMVLYLHFRDTQRIRYFAAAVFSGLLALLSKPMAVTLPAVLVLCDLYLKRPLSEQWKKPWMIPFAGLSLLFVAITLRTHTGYGIIRGGEVGNIFQNVMMACWNFFWFVGKTVWPASLSAYVPVPSTTPATFAAYLLSLFGVMALVTGLGFYSWRRGFRLLPFAVFFFIAALLPVSRLVPIGIRYMVADRFFYIPGIGFLMLLAYGLVHWIRSPGALRALRVTVVALLVLFWGVLSFAQSRVWQTSETLWAHVLKRVPDASVALNGLALASLDEGRLDQSETFLEQSLRANPDFEETWALRARLAYRKGDLPAARRYLAEAEARNLSPLLGADIKAKLLSLSGDHRGAILALGSYVEVVPAGYWFYYSMAWEALHIGEVEKAIACMEKAQALASVQQSALGRYLAQNDPEWLQQPVLVRHWAAGIDAFRNIYEFSREIHFWAKDEDRALREYDLILTHFEDALACWRRAAAVTTAECPIPSAELKNFDRKLGIVFYNKGCILAKAGMEDAALAVLAKAVQLDSRLKTNVMADADLSSLRQRFEYQEMIL